MARVREMSAGRVQVPWGFVSVLKEFRLDPTGNKKPSDDFKQKLTSLNKCF